ncbi:MAG: ABC transporter substrate-binding protein [Clostridiaceae bacterium]|nr:ABC transporter substrate-binding protein [Clostridiaceae bacterium]
MKKFISFIMVLTFLLSFAGCGRASDSKNPDVPTTTSPSQEATETPASSLEPENTDFPVTVTDSRGIDITIEEKPDSIISLMPSNTEILYAIDEGDNIIAVSEYCNFPEDTANKQKLPSGEQMSIEVLIGLNPDLVILGHMAAVDDQIKQLEEVGIKVIVTEANNLDQTYEVINLLGSVTGKKEDAASVVENMKKGFENIREEVKDKTPVSIYVEVSPLEYGLWSCGKNTFIQEIIDIIGAKNIFEDVEGWAAVSEEQVLFRNPDVILTTASPLTGMDDPIVEIMSRPNWDNINAVKNNKVLMLDADMVTRPGPRLLDCAEELVTAIYGD